VIVHFEPQRQSSLLRQNPCVDVRHQYWILVLGSTMYTLLENVTRALEEAATHAYARSRGTRKLDDLGDFSSFWKSYGFLQHRDGDRSSLKAATVSKLFRVQCQLDSAITILEDFLESATQLRSRFDHSLEPVVSALSKGLTSLPDELLALIFECTMTPDAEPQQAIWLSHVSRRFRRVALGDPNLWTTLQS